MALFPSTLSTLTPTSCERGSGNSVIFVVDIPWLAAGTSVHQNNVLLEINFVRELLTRSGIQLIVSGLH